MELEVILSLKFKKKKQDSFLLLFPITFVGVDLFGSLSIKILLIFVSQPQEQRQLLKLLPKSNTDLDMYRKEKFGINMRSQFLMSGQFWLFQAVLVGGQGYKRLGPISSLFHSRKSEVKLFFSDRLFSVFNQCSWSIILDVVFVY